MFERVDNKKKVFLKLLMELVIDQNNFLKIYSKDLMFQKKDVVDFLADDDISEINNYIQKLMLAEGVLNDLNQLNIFFSLLKKG